MFRNILVALDGSEVSQRALAEAVDQAKMWNAKLQAIFITATAVLNELSTDPTFGVNNAYEMERILQKEGDEVLESSRKYCTEKGISIITHMKYGDPGIEIISLCEKEKCDLIIVASHGKSDLDRFLLGSVSSFVVTHNKVMTLVVRGNEEKEKKS
jgi:nucleotide-binding universal stress UspA family protein